MPVIINPPDRPFPPGHPFAHPCILFVASHGSAGTLEPAAAGSNDEPSKVGEEAFSRFRQRLWHDVATSIKYPLVPQRERDLEDIAFEILRERYQGR